MPPRWQLGVWATMPGQRWRTPPSHPAATHPSSAAFCVVWVSCHVNVGKCCTYERHCCGSRPGEFRTVFQASVHMMRFGVMGPYRGFVPTIVRKAPATTLLFVLYEQLRLHFGICSLGGEKYNWDDRAAHSEFDKNTMWTFTNVFLR